MASDMIEKAKAAAGHPRGLPPLFFTELWERFSYYGMRALLTLFMVAPLADGGLALSTAEAARIYGNYTMAVYMLAIPGGVVADRYLGARCAVMTGGVVIALGHMCLAWPANASFLAGLVLIALGSGLMKPNISAMVGALYAPGDPRRDAGFSIFYLGINLGAFLAPFVTGALAQGAWFKAILASSGIDPSLSWHFGFGAAAVGMLIGVAAFYFHGGHLAGVGDPPPQARLSWTLVATVFAGTLALMGLVVASDTPGWTWLRGLYVAVPLGLIAALVRRDDVEAGRLAAVMAFFLSAMVFWALFEQAGFTLALFADQATARTIAGIDIPSSWYQALNPLFVIALAPLFAWGWVRLGERQPGSPVKFALGLALLSASYVLMVPAALATASGRVSPLWLAGLFFLQTLGELCLSPVGLSTMTKLAPPRLVGLVLGLWFLAASFGSKLAAVLGGDFETADPTRLATFFAVLAVLAAASAALMLAATPWLKRRMAGVR